MSAAGRFAIEVREDIRSAKLLSAAVMGFVSAANLIASSFAVGTSIFDGSLAPYAVSGVGLLIFGSLVGCAFAALFSGLRSATAKPPLPALLVLAGIGTALNLGAQSLFVTVVAVMAISAALTGICFLLIGRLGAASLLRFIPYPVSGGFLAGTGGVACLLALSLMGLDFGVRPIASLLDADRVMVWGPGLLFGICLFLASRRWRRVPIVPLGSLVAAGLVHLGLLVFGVSVDQAQTAELLLSGAGAGGMWPSIELGDLSAIAWGSVAAQSPEILTIVFLNLVAMVLALGGLELGSRQELNWDGEFVAAGATAITSAAGGGPASCLTVVQSLRNRMFGADTRLTALFTAGVLGLALAYGGRIVGLIPTPVVGGILLCTGISLVNDWVVRNRKRLPATEFGILASIFGAILMFGFLEGVGIGMLVTIVLLIFRLSRLDPIKARHSVREQRSNRRRSIPAQAILKEEGKRGGIYQLRGYVFFGSAYSLFSRLEEDLATSRSVCIVLDLRQVSGFDFSAVRSLCTFVSKAHAAHWQVIICGGTDRFNRRLEDNLSAVEYRWLILEGDLDRALERCEDAVINTCEAEKPEQDFQRTLIERVADDMVDQLDRHAFFEDMIGELHDWIEPHGYAAGATVSGPDQPLRGLLLLVGGKVSVFDSAGRRLRQCGPGDVLDAGAAFGDMKTDTHTVADRSCWVAMLTPTARQLLEERDRTLALKVYRYVILRSRATSR